MQPDSKPKIIYAIEEHYKTSTTFYQSMKRLANAFETLLKDNSLTEEQKQKLSSLAAPYLLLMQKEKFPQQLSTQPIDAEQEVKAVYSYYMTQDFQSAWEAVQVIALAQKDMDEFLNTLTHSQLNTAMQGGQYEFKSHITMPMQFLLRQKLLVKNINDRAENELKESDDYKQAMSVIDNKSSEFNRQMALNDFNLVKDKLTTYLSSIIEKNHPILLMIDQIISENSKNIEQALIDIFKLVSSLNLSFNQRNKLTNLLNKYMSSTEFQTLQSNLFNSFEIEFINLIKKNASIIEKSKLHTDDLSRASKLVQESFIGNTIRSASELIDAIKMMLVTIASLPKEFAKLTAGTITSLITNTTAVFLKHEPENNVQKTVHAPIQPTKEKSLFITSEQKKALLREGFLGKRMIIGAHRSAAVTSPPKKLKSVI